MKTVRLTKAGSSKDPQGDEPPARFDARRLPLAGMASIAASLALVAIVRAVAGALFTVPDGFQPLQPKDWIALTVIAVAVATAGCGVLNRRSRRPLRLFRRLAPAVLIVSLAAPLLAWAAKPWPGTNGSTVAVLVVMHVAVALCCIVLLPALGRPRSAAAAR